MKKKILLQDLANHIAKADSIPVKTAEAFVRAFFSTIEQGLGNDNFVKIKGFGTFKIVAVSERESVNINTGERFQISGHTKVTFTPDASLRDLVNKPFAHFEAVDLNEGTAAEEFEDIDRRMGEEDFAEEDAETGEATLSDAPASSDDATEEEDAQSAPTEQLPATDQEEYSLTTDSEAESPEEPSPRPLAMPPAPDSGPDEMPQEVATDNDTPSPILETGSTAEHKEEIASTSAYTSHEEVADVPSESPHRDGEISTHEAEGDPRLHPQARSDEASGQSSTHGSASQNITYTYNDTPSRRKKGTWKKILGVLTLLCLMAGCYFAGYFRLLCPCVLPLWDSQKQTTPVPSSPAHKVAPRPQTPVAPATPSTSPAPTPSDSAKSPRQGDAAPAVPRPAKTSPQPTEAKTGKQAQAEAPHFPRQATRTYVVRKGDNLSRIARQFYGTDKYVPFILRHNRLKDANCIHPGTRLELPSR